MKIKRYIGKDSHEAMMKVRMDLGSDAIILNTRKIKQKGLTKLFAKPLVEVLAAIDEGANKPRKTNMSANVHYEPTASGQSLPGRNDNTEKQEKGEGQEESTESLKNKVYNMEQMLQRIYAQMRPGNTDAVAVDEMPPRLSVQNDTNKTYKIIQIFSDNLLKNSVDSSIVKNLVQNVENNITSTSNVNDIAAKMYNHIISILGTPQAIQLKEEEDKAKVVAFVGPTGAGKTTTLAKIAAIFSIDYNKQIGIISTDTYRIAAVEQLKTYAQILGSPVSVIYAPEEINKAIDDFSDKELIFIDTAGRSHNDIEQFEELKKIIALSDPDEIFLLISLTTDYNVCKEIVKSYSFLKDYKVIFTKMDESFNSGMILNLRKFTDKRLSYVTTGQSVPDDIEIVNIDKIAKKLLGSIRV